MWREQQLSKTRTQFVAAFLRRSWSIRKSGQLARCSGTWSMGECRRECSHPWCSPIFCSVVSTLLQFDRISEERKNRNCRECYKNKVKSSQTSSSSSNSKREIRRVKDKKKNLPVSRRANSNDVFSCSLSGRAEPDNDTFPVIYVAKCKWWLVLRHKPRCNNDVSELFGLKRHLAYAIWVRLHTMST